MRHLQSIVSTRAMPQFIVDGLRSATNKNRHNLLAHPQVPSALPRHKYRSCRSPVPTETTMIVSRRGYSDRAPHMRHRGVVDDTPPSTHANSLLLLSNGPGGKNVGAAEVPSRSQLTPVERGIPSDSVALKKNGSCPCNHSWKSTGSECRPELGVVEEFHQAAEGIRRILGKNDLSPMSKNAS